MKTLRDVAGILGVSVRNETEYSRYVLEKVLDALRIPDEPAVRLQQFRVDNPFGSGDLRLDFLIAIGGLPMVVIEAKKSDADFDAARAEAINYARNFDPKESAVRKMTPPFVLAAAGKRAEMSRATAKGIEIVYEPILAAGVAAFLEWPELVNEANAFAGLSGAQPLSPAAATGARTALELEIVKTFLDDLHGALYGKLRDRDDERVRVLDAILLAARASDPAGALDAAAKARLPQGAIKRIKATLSKYDASLRSGLLDGPAAGAAYRELITTERSSGGLDLFTGESQTRPYREKGKIRYRRTARFFTPTEIIREMVRLTQPRRGERIIDPTCGSGGFLAEMVTVLAGGDDRIARSTLGESLVGIDDDPFCVDVSRTLLQLLVPGCDPQVYLHNALYERAPERGEIEEDAAANRHLVSDRYDLVIGNPPGNKQYSGSNHETVEELWRTQFGIDRNLWDCAYFLRRALDLARPDGGRICLLLPESFFANAKMEPLRRLVLAEARPLAIISVPKVFRNTKAAMAILYAVRTGTWLPGRRKLATWRADDPVFLGEVAESTSGDDGVATQLPNELKDAVDRYLAKPAVEGNAAADGLRAFGQPTVLLSGLTHAGGDETSDD